MILVLTSRDKKKEKKKRKFECEKRKIKSDRQKGSEFFKFFTQFKSTTHTLAKIHCGPDWKNRELASVGEVLLTTVIRGPKQTQRGPVENPKRPSSRTNPCSALQRTKWPREKEEGGRWSTMEF